MKKPITVGPSGTAPEKPVVKLANGEPGSRCKQALRVADAAVRLGVSIPTIWRYARLNPEFPKPIKISAGVTVFDADELDAFVDSRRTTA